ncbi:MAG: pseudouridine synthase [bacterium]
MVIPYKPIVVILLHKPIGYVCSDVAEGKYKSYRMLLDDCIYKETLHVAGRLDADTTGLVLITNDGDLNHHIISPKKKMVKTYEVQVEKVINDAAIKQLEAGVVLEDGYHTLPAQVIKKSEKNIVLMIHEGKYHQVKRMLEAVDNKVVKLHRTQIGKCIL